MYFQIIIQGLRGIKYQPLYTEIFRCWTLPQPYSLFSILMHLLVWRHNHFNRRTFFHFIQTTAKPFPIDYKGHLVVKGSTYIYPHSFSTWTTFSLYYNYNQTILLCFKISSHTQGVQKNWHYCLTSINKCQCVEGVVCGPASTIIIYCHTAVDMAYDGEGTTFNCNKFYYYQLH